MQPNTTQALITATFSRRMEVKLASGETVNGRVSGRKLQPVCGDRVKVKPISNEPEWLITDVLPRDNELGRPNSRGKIEILAANLDFICVVTASLPVPDWFIVDRYLSAAALMQIDAAVVFNKTDIAQPDSSGTDALRSYAQIGYPTICCSAKSGENMQSFAELFVDKVAIIVGQSGVGKSSLINFMIANAAQRTAKVSRATGEGRHTTVNSVMLPLSGGGSVIDSPGVRDYAPATMTATDVIRGFREIETAGYNCKFANCLHLREPDCAVKLAIADGTIDARRYESYRRLQAMTERRVDTRKPKH